MSDVREIENGFNMNVGIKVIDNWVLVGVISPNDNTVLTGTKLFNDDSYMDNLMMAKAHGFFIKNKYGKC